MCSLVAFRSSLSKATRARQMLVTKGEGEAACELVFRVRGWWTAKRFWWLIFPTVATLVKLPIKFTKAWAVIFLRFRQ